MSVKFKCNQSGNVFEYFTEHDIKTMRTHSEYTEVKEEEKETLQSVGTSEEMSTIRKPGRPKKEQ